jgi:hypothetical protein
VNPWLGRAKTVPIGEVQASANGLLFGPQNPIGVPERARGPEGKTADSRLYEGDIPDILL